MRQEFHRMSDMFTFGKHKGETLVDVIREDAQYVLWLQDEGICKFTDKILDKADDAAQRQRIDYLRENYSEGDLEF